MRHAVHATGSLLLIARSSETLLIARSPPRFSLSLVLLTLFSAFLTISTSLYASNTWPFERKSWLDCTIRVAQASLFLDPMPTKPDYSALHRAQSLDPSVLMDGLGPPAEPGRTPRLIHQSWKDRELPHRFKTWSDSWRRHHPNWYYVLWSVADSLLRLCALTTARRTDADNLELVTRFYPQYLDAYLKLPSEIYRADMVRNCLMHRFGGIYADLDVESIQPLDALLDVPAEREGMATAYVGKMDTEGDELAEPNSIPNAFMASTAPGHPFWLGPLDYVVRHLRDPNDEPEWLTGPVPLRACTLAYESRHDASLVVLEPPTIYPYSWSMASPYQHCVCSAQAPTLDPARCQSLWKGQGAFALTYWSQRCVDGASLGCC